MSKKVMKLIDPSTGLMECKVCGSRHLSNLLPAYKQKDGKSGFYYYGSWQCVNKCKLPDEEKFF